MPRPTREFKTSAGHTLVLNEYITGAENWQIREIYRATAEAKSDKDLDAEKKALELIVVSLDGDTSNVPQRVLDIPLTNYREVVDEITPIVEGKKKLETS